MNYQDFLKTKALIDPDTGLKKIGKLNPNDKDFQRDIVKWALRRGRAAIWADCGLGKGLMALDWADHVPGEVLIVAPLAVSQQFVREAAKFGVDIGIAKDQDQITKRITVTNYDRVQNFDPARFAGVVLDECFPPNALVDVIENSASSQKYIKDIRPNELIANANGRDRVVETHRRRIERAIKISVNGQRITASENHPFYTQRGWVSAIDLAPDDYLMEAATAVRLVSGGVCAEVPECLDHAVLRDILLSEMADEANKNPSESAHGGSRVKARPIQIGMASQRMSERESRDRKGQALKSDVQSSRQSQGEPDIASDEVQTFRTWWKRTGTDDATIDPNAHSIKRMDSGICLVAGETKGWLSNALQARLSVSRKETLHRGGWQQPLCSQGIGHEERRYAGFSRVDGIEILEQGHPELEQWRDADGFVYFYDIKAERHPSFSVNGFLVHNSSILKSFDGATRTLLISMFAQTPFRLCCTATPAPNDHMELGNHAEFLGVMTRTEMLSMFFVHDGGETQKWRIKGHAEKEFWKWICSWAVMLRKPSDLGYDDEDFKLPPIEFHQHQVDSGVPAEGMLFAMPASTLQERIGARRSSTKDRVALAAEIANDIPIKRQVLIFCNLNGESEALTKAIAGAVEVKGSDSAEHKEKAVVDFIEGRTRAIVSKPVMFGYGLNLQNCSDVIFVGLSDSYEQFYQALRRCWRFGQKNTVNVHMITAKTEGAVLSNIQRKEADANRMADGMLVNMREINSAMIHGGTVRMKSNYERECKIGRGWKAYLGDCVDVAAELPDNSIHYTIYSPPFASLYTYSNSDRDMGNSLNHDQFFEHYRFLVGLLYQKTIPGRLVSFHCMNMPTSKVRDGVIGLTDFRGQLIKMHQEAGWIFHSEVCIWKDPVTAMQRTKALGLLHKQLKKDSCMSRQGIPDYLVTMRKPGDNPERVSHTNDSFPVQVWQNYASPVWMDIDPSDTLQYRSAREHNDERHICPLQLEVIRRGVRLWSNPGDTVFSPFMGIASEGHVALQMGRQFVGIELKRSYWEQAWRNLDAARAGNDGLFRVDVGDESKQPMWAGEPISA